MPLETLVQKFDIVPGEAGKLTRRIRTNNAGTGDGDTVTIFKDSVLVAQRTRINFLTGTNLTLTVLDVPANDWATIEVDHTRGLIVFLCAAFTPTATGGDTAEFTVPYSVDGTTSVTWTLRRVTLRVQTAGGAPAVTIEKSTATGAFSATSVGSVTMGGGNYEVSSTSSLGTVASGNKLRFNPTALGTAANWTISVEMSNP